MSSSPNINEWNLLKEEFDALVHDEGARRDSFGKILDDQILLRFGELIAWAAGHKAKGYHGPWPPGPYRAIGSGPRHNPPGLGAAPFCPAASGIKRGQNRWVFRQGPGQKYIKVQTHSVNVFAFPADAATSSTSSETS